MQAVCEKPADTWRDKRSQPSKTYRRHATDVTLPASGNSDTVDSCCLNKMLYAQWLITESIYHVISQFLCTFRTFDGSLDNG